MPAASPAENTHLSADTWRERARVHRERAAQWTQPYRRRRAAGDLHPIYDFLFIYYRNKPSQLEHWHPGIGVTMGDCPLEPPFKETEYVERNGCTSLDPSKMNSATRHRMEMALRLCERVRERPPSFGCSGMHEWAMVYKGDSEGSVRHGERLPLRLGQGETDAFVRSRPIQCSHFDAFRFFSEAAKPYNRMQPSKDTRMENEQCGCLHTNMDLYKLSTHCMPWVGSDLLWACFEFAVSARQLDMQASPYDCSRLGFEAVKIETPEGRAEYERRQRALSEAAAPLRDQLIAQLERSLAQIGPTAKA